MKIGFLITYFYPRLGGAESNCYYLARELVTRKHEVHVFCSDARTKDETLGGIHVHRARELLRIKYYLAWYPALYASLKQTKLDILHVHGLGFPQHDSFVARLRQDFPTLKLVCTPHGPFMALSSYSLLGKIVKRVYTTLVKRTIPWYDRFIQVNTTQWKWMTQEYAIPREKIRYVPNGIPLEAFAVPARTVVSRLTNKYDLSGKTILTYVGRIQRYKGLDQVIAALPVLVKKDHSLVFVAIGKDHGDHARLVALAQSLGVEKHVVFTGMLPDVEMRALLSLSEIFVFPSQWEAFGIVLLEAMAQGNAIVASDTEGTTFLRSQGMRGLLFTYGNKHQCAEKLEKLLSSPKQLRSMQQKNKQVARKFLWSSAALQLEQVYRELV